MLCSIIIPSRKRFDLLKRSINSIYGSISDCDSVEIFVIFDDDDNQAKSRHHELNPGDKLTVIFGPRREGYPSIEERIMETVPLCSGTWLLGYWNDDAVMETSGTCFDTELAKITPTNCVVHPACQQIGASKYHNTGCAFPIVPMKCWEQHGEYPTRPWDTWLNVFGEKHGWKQVFLPNINFNHQWLGGVSKGGPD